MLLRKFSMPCSIKLESMATINFAASGAPVPLASKLQSTFQQIETLGNPAAGASLPLSAAIKPLTASSRVTDTIAGNVFHDVHKLRPASIPEHAVAVPPEMTSALAETKASRTKYIIGIVVILLLLIGIFVAIYFLRRRNQQKAQAEAQRALQQSTESGAHEGFDVSENEEDESSEEDIPLPPPPALVPAVIPDPPSIPPAVPLREQESVNMENAVARTLEKRKRLETLKSQLDKGITNVVANVSETVAKTIASQKAFEAHTATQEHDEKVLLNQGNPSMSTMPMDDAHVPSEAVLDIPIDSHPTGTRPVGGDDGGNEGDDQVEQDQQTE